MTLTDYLARVCLAWIGEASLQLAALIAIVTLLAWLLRNQAPRLRYALWLLVLVKIFLPPSLAAPWSLRSLASGPLDRLSGSLDEAGYASETWLAPRPSEDEAETIAAAGGEVSLAEILAAGWLAGCLAFWLAVAWRYWAVSRAVDASPELDEGPVRVAYEEMALALELRSVPALHLTDTLSSPFLIGLVRPRIAIPERMLSLDENELRAVLLHELVHYKHGDMYLGWLQVVALGPFWFHPLVWWASRQVRHCRELVCDEAVLRQGQISAHRYGESIVHVLTASRGQSLVTGGLVGVFERGTNLYDRLENIMKYDARNARLGFGSLAAVGLLGLFLLPMGPGAKGAPADVSAPKIVSTTPGIGAKNVDPNLGEITVTFDRDMNSGMSWTGAAPEFPPLDESRQAGWRDKRTCYLPVKLSPGAMYRVGVNSTSHRNFKSASGTPAAPAVIYFTTKGASAEVQEQVRAPQLVRLEPANGATDVDPKTSAIKATFDIPMNAGMSWTGGGSTFPKIPAGKKPAWSADGLTCTLPIELEPGREYTLGLNSPSHKNFQSKAGVPLEPVVYKFRTASK